MASQRQLSALIQQGVGRCIRAFPSRHRKVTYAVNALPVHHAGAAPPIEVQGMYAQTDVPFPSITLGRLTAPLLFRLAIASRNIVHLKCRRTRPRPHNDRFFPSNPSLTSSIQATSSRSLHRAANGDSL